MGCNKIVVQNLYNWFRFTHFNRMYMLCGCSKFSSWIYLIIC